MSARVKVIGTPPKMSPEAIRIAIQIRDDSIEEAFPDLNLPDSLPQNVQSLAEGLLTEEELVITNSDTVALVDKLRKREWLCETVTRAFLKRAAIAQKAVNCITELLPTHAIERARYLDSLRESAGPLHGLPISVKEQFGFEGKINNNGFVANCTRLQTNPCTLNDVLESACGAVIVARTSQPQSVMHLEINNNIYGRTVSPWNANLTAGGSSGGEGALVGLKASPLGIGGDIGGSIRSSAANNGIYGFKPTPYRIGNTGGMGLITGQEGSVQLPKKLKIAVMWSDGLVRPHPPIHRGLSEVTDTLRSDPNFQVVDWVPVDHDTCWKITCALYWEDGGRRLREVLKAGNEEVLPLTQWLLDQEEMKPRSTEDIWKLKTMRNSYRAMYNQHWIDTGKEDAHPVDAILCPVGPGCAPPHDQARYWHYTSQWNMLEYPAISFPVGHVNQTLDVPDASYEPLNRDDAFNHTLYTGPERYRDAPISLQLVTRRYEDEKCIEVLKRIEEVFKKEVPS